MSLDLTELRADLHAMVNDLPVTFTFSGTGYTGCRDVATATDELLAGGFAGDELLNLHVPLKTTTGANTFTVEPASGTFVAIGGVTYTVIRADHSLDGLELILGLKG